MKGNDVNMQKFTTWGLALGLAGVLLAGTIHNEPAMADVEAMQAADLKDAIESARRFDRDLRACKQALGPSADLVQIAGTDDYVCREMPIEPTPAELLHRYAELAGRKI